MTEIISTSSEPSAKINTYKNDTVLHVGRGICFSALAASCVPFSLIDLNYATTTWFDPSYGHALPRTPTSNLTSTFVELAKRWKLETNTPSSRFTDIVTNKSYLGIISLGWQVVPLILAELAESPDHWGLALESISGENPVPPEAEGDIDAIAQAWLDWGRKHQFCV